jgi:hypothetical protein
MPTSWQQIIDDECEELYDNGGKRNEFFDQPKNTNLFSISGATKYDLIIK